MSPSPPGSPQRARPAPSWVGSRWLPSFVSTHQGTSLPVNRGFITCPLPTLLPGPERWEGVVNFSEEKDRDNGTGEIGREPAQGQPSARCFPEEVDRRRTASPVGFWKGQHSVRPSSTLRWVGKRVIRELGPRLLQLRSKPRTSASFPTLPGHRLQGKWNQQRRGPCSGGEESREPPYL